MTTVRRTSAGEWGNRGNYIGSFNSHGYSGEKDTPSAFIYLCVNVDSTKYTREKSLCCFEDREFSRCGDSTFRDSSISKNRVKKKKKNSYLISHGSSLRDHLSGPILVSCASGCSSPVSSCIYMCRPESRSSLSLNTISKHDSEFKFKLNSKNKNRNDREPNAEEFFSSDICQESLSRQFDPESRRRASRARVNARCVSCAIERSKASIVFGVSVVGAARRRRDSSV